MLDAECLTQPTDSVIQKVLVHFRSQGSKCDIPSIPPTLNTSPSARQDSENIQADVVEPGSNENFASTSIGFGGENGAIIDVAGNGHGIECSDSLCEKMNSVEIAEHADIELSRSLNDSETSSKKIVTDLLSTSNENTEEACIGDMKSATLDADAGNCCPAGTCYININYGIVYMACMNGFLIGLSKQ